MFEQIGKPTVDGIQKGIQDEKRTLHPQYGMSLAGQSSVAEKGLMLVPRPALHATRSASRWSKALRSESAPEVMM